MEKVLTGGTALWKGRSSMFKHPVAARTELKFEVEQKGLLLLLRLAGELMMSQRWAGPWEPREGAGFPQGYTEA